MLDSETNDESIVDGVSLLDLAYEHPEKLLKALDRLEFYRNHDQPHYYDYYSFDVERRRDRPAKFEKMQVLQALNVVIDCVEVTREYFYWYLATHTNLSPNPATIKKMFQRC